MNPHLEDECHHLEDECRHLEDECKHLEDEPSVPRMNALIMDMQSARIAGFHGNSISFPSSGGSRQIYTINPILIQ